MSKWMVWDSAITPVRAKAESAKRTRVLNISIDVDENWGESLSRIATDEISGADERKVKLFR